MTSLQEALPLCDMSEIAPASAWCQRWSGGRHSFRHVSDGGFDARHYAVELLAEQEAKRFVVEHHYSASFPAARFCLGLFHTSSGEDRLCGVAVFGVPVTAAVLSRPLPDLVPSAH